MSVTASVPERRKYPVYFVEADDHASYEGGRDDAVNAPAHVWAAGIPVYRDRTRWVLATAQAKFIGEPVESSAQTSLTTVRRPFRARRVGEVML